MGCQQAPGSSASACRPPVCGGSISGVYQDSLPLFCQMRKPLSLLEPPPRLGESKRTGPLQPSGRLHILVLSHNHGHYRGHTTTLVTTWPTRTALPRPASSALAGAVLALLSFSKNLSPHPRAFFVVQSNTSHLHTHLKAPPCQPPPRVPRHRVAARVPQILSVSIKGMHFSSPPLCAEQQIRGW